jgi:allophanate hydrolase
MQQPVHLEPSEILEAYMTSRTFDSMTGGTDPVPKLSNLQLPYLRAGYVAGTMSPVDIVRQVYKSIYSYHDKAVWIHVVPEAALLARAQQLVAAHRDLDALPPLFGIPFSVKDSIDVAGLPTTLACPSFAYTADANAVAVEKVLQAGAILVGKTNLDQFATGLTGTRSPYGAPRSVLDSDYISGGSSSGSAVSVAASLVSFSICTDTGGSTRVPAALNGVVGFKPTLGCISATGLFPACKNIDCVCIMARTVDDADVVWNVAKSFDLSDPFSRRELPSWAPWGNPIRFGVPCTEALETLSPAYARLFRGTITALCGSADYVSKEFDYSPFESGNQMLYDSSIVAQRLLAFEDYTSSHGLEALHPAIKVTFESARANAFDAIKAYKDIFSLAHHKRNAETEFSKIDILIVPSTICHWTMAELEEDPMGRNKVMGKFTNFVNLLDLCAISVPVGTWQSVNDKNMSFGVTIVGQAGKDAEVLRAGKKVMELFSSC